MKRTDGTKERPWRKKCPECLYHMPAHCMEDWAVQTGPDYGWQYFHCPTNCDKNCPVCAAWTPPEVMGL
jgi:hypothetical protein